MMSGPGWLIQDIVGEGVSSDGNHVHFRFTCTDGRKTYDLCFHCAEQFVPHLVAHLARAAEAAREARGASVHRT